MPKVNLYERTYGGRDEKGERLPDPQPRRISIGWSKGLHAQLGVGWVNPDMSAKDVGTGWSDEYIGSAETDESGKVWQSQWVDLDRHMVNQLIRELRNARDAAFGRDE